ncbi:MAG: glycosyltransferase [Pirellulales bacterium]|nr:glycosyltransferase [Pirellulales bacterium]
MAEKLAITFVLPVLNETDSLRATVQTIRRLATDYLHEVLIVTAERSTPESLQVARQVAQGSPDDVRVYRQQLPHLGGALREAFAQANGSHVMLMASDLETDPELIPGFVEKMQEGCWDIVSGSRWLTGGGFEDYGRMRMLLNWAFQRCFRLLYFAPLTDLTFAYRLYRREVLDGICWEELGHPFLLECLLKPLRLGARIAEVPCRWRSRREGESAGSYRQMLEYVPLAIRIRFQPRDRIRPS